MFKLEENGTSVRTELLAGLTTYVTMVYIAFVNPAMLAETGMDKGAVFVAGRKAPGTLGPFALRVDLARP